MVTRWQLTAVTLCVILTAPSLLHADIYRWDNGRVIPGTEGITQGPGVQLDQRNLGYADLSNENLTGANFFLSSLANADLSGANLTDSYLPQCNLTGANLTGAVITKAHLSNTVKFGFTQDQLYSTASYQARNLNGIELGWGSGMSFPDLSGWDFHGQNLTRAGLFFTRLTNADLSGADLTAASLLLSWLDGANLAGAVVTRTNFRGTTERGFTKEQLYSTASYQKKNLQGIGLDANDLTGWDFRGQNLANADIGYSTLNSAIFDSATVYNQWTVFPDDFDPVTAGLRFTPSAVGDFDADDLLDESDVDLLTARLTFAFPGFGWPLPDAMFDLSRDGNIDDEDHRIWIQDLNRTWFGDANLDGEFNSADFVQVFASGKYETSWVDASGAKYGENASWSEGDWNADGFFDSDDFVTAFADGGYEQGSRMDAAAVPEPTTLGLVLAAAFVLFSCMRADGRRFALLLTLLCAPFCNAHADVYRWDNGQVIPGTEGITPGPAVQLDHRQLQYADLRESDLTGASFVQSDLTLASLNLSTLTDVNLSGAVILVANFAYTTGFTKEQLYSTTSYRDKNLLGIQLAGNDLIDWDLSGQNLISAGLSESNLTNANLTGALLRAADLTDANMTGAVVRGTDFFDTTFPGITKDQLYSTASYQDKDLQHIGLTGCDLTDWDLSGQNLIGADLSSSNLTNANLMKAVVTGAKFNGTASRGLTKEQFYSTASYQSGNLREVELGGNNLSGWNFSGHDLTGAQFSGFGGVPPRVYAANLTDTDLTGATVAGANFTGLTSHGFAKDQLYSTASYRAEDLQGVILWMNDLTGWDFSGQNLANADLASSTLTDADLSGANLANANLGSSPRTGDATGDAILQSAIFDSATVYNQWTVFPEDFDPVASGLTLVMSPTGDLDADDALDAADVDMLANKIGGRWNRVWWLPDAAFDMNGDGTVNKDDHRVWVKGISYTWYGDADLNGGFNSNDFVQVFQAGKYEQGWFDEWGYPRGGLAGWSQGDWNGDGIFDSSDFITAFTDGGYEQGPRTDVAAVPEPGGWLLLILGLAGVMRRRGAA